MGEMYELVEQYCDERHQHPATYNQQEFLDWLCGEGCLIDLEIERRELVAIVLQNFRHELDSISDNTIRHFISDCLDWFAPVASWKRPSSVNHHPEDERGLWGNLLHTKRVVKLAILLSQAEKLTKHEHDLLVAASIIHDVGKYGIDGKSDKIQENHPELVRQMIPAELIAGDVGEILGIVESHMGQWGNIQSATKLQKLCHYADYIASRDDIHIPMTLTTERNGNG